MNADSRAQELYKRKIFYLNNIVVKLFKFKKVQMYKVLIWIENGTKQISVAQDVYLNQDPVELVPKQFRQKQGIVNQ